MSFGRSRSPIVSSRIRGIDGTHWNSLEYLALCAHASKNRLSDTSSEGSSHSKHNARYRGFAETASYLVTQLFEFDFNTLKFIYKIKVYI